MLSEVNGFTLCAAAVRGCFLLYGEWQDKNLDVKFTDIDYQVFTDAAKHVADGRSPFLRSTYRYTPMLAWMLVPNILVHPMWGKICFVFMDLVSGYFIYWILLQRRVNAKLRRTSLALWLFNPLTITISTRGSAESIVSTLVLGTLYFLGKKQLVLAGIFYGLSVHFKIYPIIYCLPLYFVLEDSIPSSKPFDHFVALLRPTVDRVKFTSATIFSILAPSIFCYLLYGNVFLEEAYLYHVTRKDTWHNFSVYFYFLYLTKEWNGSIHGIVTFLLQAVLVLSVALKFHREPRLPICLFLQTFLFVTFNKVCTSQYFVWYLTFVPLILQNLKLSNWKAMQLVLLWLASQAIWLLAAYLLEFQNTNTFLFIWIAGLIFFVSNVKIAAVIMKHTL